MEINVSDTKQEMGKAAAERAASALRESLSERGAANLIVATGASQFEMLEHLVREPDVDWKNVHIFHLDEYIGLDDAHPASFCRYLRERFEEKLPEPPAAFHYLNGMAADPKAECRRVGEIIARHPIDVACIGIGENGHLAFNDPPADFEVEDPYIVVNLDEACRKQQFGEGWFDSIEDVPQQAMSMSIKQIMKSKRLVVTCPDERKAEAVKNAVKGEVTNMCPASKLQEHPNCTLFLDTPAASLL
ncbi:MAG: glucosamine-6-phosphate deaminase [Candidatus Hydrogenedentota bacterium]